MQEWKPGKVDGRSLETAHRKIVQGFLSRASNEERKILEQHDLEAVEIDLCHEHLLLRFSLYESLRGEYLGGEKDQELFPLPEESASLINTLTQEERLAIANALTTPFCPRQSDEHRRQQIEDLHVIQRRLSPYAVSTGDEEESTFTTNADIVTYLHRMHDRILSHADPSSFYVPEEEQVQDDTSDPLLKISRIIIKQIEFLTCSDEDRLLIGWITDSARPLFSPYFEQEEVAVDFSLHDDVFQRFDYSVQSGHVVITIEHEDRMFQRIINGLHPTQRNLLAETLESINVETVQEKFLAGTEPVPEAIRRRAELLRRIREGTLIED